MHRIGYVGIQSFEVQPADGQDESLPRAMTCWASQLRIVRPDRRASQVVASYK